MKRRIIEIDEKKCNGCGACANACHEGAIQMVNGKAKLMRDDYCDGLGDCLPACPVDAIHFVEREAAAYDAEAVAQNKAKKTEPLPCGCPGTMAKSLRTSSPSEDLQKSSNSCTDTHAGNKTCDNACNGDTCNGDTCSDGHNYNNSCHKLPVSRLEQWPVQIKLINVNASYLNGANLLIAADCTAYAYANMHEDFMKGRITLIGCPKLDAVDYSDKFSEILCQNEIKSISVVRMEVPCCGGIENAVKAAIQSSGKAIPLQVTTISITGQIL